MSVQGPEYESLDDVTLLRTRRPGPPRPPRQVLLLRSLVLIGATALWAVTCAVALAPALELVFVRAVVDDTSIAVSSMMFLPSPAANGSMLALCDFELVHPLSAKVPHLLRATAALEGLTVAFGVTEDGAPGAQSRTIRGGEGTGGAANTLTFPGLRLDVAAGRTAFRNVTVLVDVSPDPSGFDRLARAIFYTAGEVRIRLRGNATARVALRLLGTQRMSGVPFSKTVATPGLGRLGGAAFPEGSTAPGSASGVAALGLRVVRADALGAVVRVPVAVRNPSVLGASLGPASFALRLLPGLESVGVATIPDLVVGAGASSLELDVVLDPASSDVAARIMRRFLAGEAVTLAGQTALLRPWPLSRALGGVTFSAVLPGGHSVGMDTTHAEIVGGTSTSISVNVTYEIRNPAGYVSGELGAVTLGVYYEGDLVGVSTVRNISLPPGTSVFHEVVTMAPENLTALARVGHRYISQEAFVFSFSGLPSYPRSGVMTEFFSGWGSSLVVAGSPTALVQGLEIAKFGVTLDPPTYSVLCSASLLNPLPITLTVTGIVFTAFFNDTFGEHLGPLHILPPENNVNMGQVAIHNISFPLPPHELRNYDVWLTRTDPVLAARLFEVYILRRKLYIDLDMGLVSVDWFNLTLPFSYKHFFID